MMGNRDDEVIEGFGNEWQSYTQNYISDDELQKSFNDYFRIVDLASLPRNCVAADIGCGSGRWARLVAPHVATLYCVEPSRAIEVARRNLSGIPHVRFLNADIDSMPIAEGELDFLYSLGVLHHVPDTLAGIRSCTAKLKPGGRILIYLYYRFDSQPVWFKALWQLSDLVRKAVSRMPYRAKLIFTRAIALSVYLPLARLSGLVERLGADVTNFPLSYYRNKSLYMMKTDALDRFGTKLEHRFTKSEIQAMLETAGLDQIQFSPDKPHWCVTAVKPG